MRLIGEDLGNMLFHAGAPVAGPENGDARSVNGQGGEEKGKQNGEDPALGTG